MKAREVLAGDVIAPTPAPDKPYHGMPPDNPEVIEGLVLAVERQSVVRSCHPLVNERVSSTCGGTIRRRRSETCQSTRATVVRSIGSS